MGMAIARLKISGREGDCIGMELEWIFFGGLGLYCIYGCEGGRHCLGLEFWVLVLLGPGVSVDSLSLTR